MIPHFILLLIQESRREGGHGWRCCWNSFTYQMLPDWGGHQEWSALYQNYYYLDSPITSRHSYGYSIAGTSIRMYCYKLLDFRNVSMDYVSRTPRRLVHVLHAIFKSNQIPQSVYQSYSTVFLCYNSDKASINSGTPASRGSHSANRW